MDPKKPQIKTDDNVIDFAERKDRKIAATTPFGPMSAARDDVENRIVHKSVRKDRKKDS